MRTGELFVGRSFGAAEVEVRVLVDREYLLKKPAGPSAPKLFLDTQIVPAAVNAIGSVEVALSRISARTGVRPALLLAGAAGIMAFGMFRLLTASVAPRRDRAS
jgi:hypothetical protein